MSDRVTKWLEQLGFGQYAQAFAENAIDWNLLPELDQETLKDIGVSAAGHRLRILKAIAALQAEQSATPSSDPSAPVIETADHETEAELRRLYDEAGRAGLINALPAMEAALSAN